MSQSAPALDTGSVRVDIPAPSRRLVRLLDPVVMLGVCLSAALLLRFIALDTTVTADEGYWMHRAVRFGAALTRGDHESTFRSGHPGVTVMWAGLLGIGPARLEPYLPDRYVQSAVLEGAPGYWEAFWSARYASTLFASLLLTVAVGLSWKLLGPGPGAAGGLLLLLDPYVVGMSRLLHVDALLAPLMTVSTLAALIYWTRDRRWPYLALSAATAGLALLTKAPAAALLPYVGLLALASPCLGTARWRPILPLLAWGAIAASLYFLLWPALWVDPIRQLGRVAAYAVEKGMNPHDSPVVFLGAIVRQDPGPLFYAVALGYRLGPATLLGLALAVVELARARRRSVAALWLLAYAVLFVGLMTLGAKKFDRYALPAIWALDLLAGVGLWSLATGFRRPAARALALAAIVAAQGFLLWRAYPYPIAFYNPPLGGVAGAEKALLIGWGEGMDQVTDYLNARPDAERLLVATHYDHTVRPRFRGSTISMRAYFPRQQNAPAPPSPNYYVLYISSVQRRLIPPEARTLITAGPAEFVAMVNGSPYAWVYRVPWAPAYRTDTQPVPEDEEEEGE